jgi:NAD(P)H dehydrogenase (quinone)
VAADYNDRASLDAALAGTDTLLFISSSEPGRRITQHSNVVAAATAAGVGFIVYTSAPYAATTSMLLAADHKATEEAIRATGIPFAFLRNGWYFENYYAALGQTIEHGALFGSAGQGKISGAARADLAEATAAVLTGPAPTGEGDVYELGGDEAFTLAELTAEISRLAGKPVVYNDLPPVEYAKFLASVGVPEPFNEILADSDRAISVGELYIDSGDLHRLLGRPTTPLADSLSAAVKAL